MASFCKPVRICHNLLIHSPINGHSGSFQASTTMNNAALTCHAHFTQAHIQGQIPGNECWRSKGLCTYLDIEKLPSLMFFPIYILTCKHLCFPKLVNRVCYQTFPFFFSLNHKNSISIFVV